MSQTTLPNEGISYREALYQRLSGVLYRCLEDVGSTKAALYLVLPGMHEFQLVSHYGWPRTQPPPAHLGPDHPILVLMQRERRGLISNDLAGYPELAPFCPGTSNPRFYLAPVFSSGEWVGLLIQRDPHKGIPFSLDKHQAATTDICQEVARNMDAAITRPTPPIREEVPPLRVPAPPTAAMVKPQDRVRPQEGQAMEDFLFSLGEEPEPEPEPPAPPQVRAAEFQEPAAESNLVLPEQQIFFWEAASMLCATVPIGAVALYVAETTDLHPILTFSRAPLAVELKRQVLTHFISQLPQLDPSEFRLVTRCQLPEKEPQTGKFMTLLPVMLEEQFGENDLLVLFRLEDRPFTVFEQEFIRQVSRMLGFYLQEARLHERYHQSFLSVSHRILASADGRLPGLRPQSLNTAERSRDLARRLGLTSAEVEAVSIAAILHDVGTLLLDRTILDKPELSPEDLEKVRTHPILASTFLTDLSFPFDILRIIRHHHERWDGLGYPDGIRREAIPVGSRIIHLVESYEVMTAGAPYKPSKPVAEAVAEIQQLAGTQFDPAMVKEFVQMLKEGHF